MQRYIGTKIVDAEPQMRNGKEGYKVFLDKARGYWIPKDAFEKAYKPVEAMTFSQAMDAMEAGLVVRRRSWPFRQNLRIVHIDASASGVAIQRKQLMKMRPDDGLDPDNNILFEDRLYLDNVALNDVFAQDWLVVSMPAMAKPPECGC